MTFGDVWEFLSEHREHKVLRSSITLGDILNDMLKCHQEVINAKLTIAALTDRAEQAEKERDALVKSVDRLVEAWENFKSPALIELVKQWRGQPQDGEGL